MCVGKFLGFDSEKSEKSTNFACNYLAFNPKGELCTCLAGKIFTRFYQKFSALGQGAKYLPLLQFSLYLMRSLPAHLSILLLACLLLACKKSSKNLAIKIPADAHFAVVLDMKRMSNKAVEWKDILSTQFLQNVTGNTESTDMLSKVLNNGFDYQKEVCIFGNANQSDTYIAVAFSLKDFKAFEKMLQKDYPDVSIKTVKNAKQAHLKQGVLVHWQKNIALALIAPTSSQEALEYITQKIYKTKSSESLTSQNTVFQTALQQNNDITGWVNPHTASDKVLQQLKKFGINLPVQLDGIAHILTEATFHTNFEQGEIKSQTKGYFKAELAEPYTKFAKTGISPELAKYIPIEKPTVLMGVGVNPESLEGVLGNSSMVNLFKGLLAFSGTSLPQVLSEYTGDMVLALDKPKATTDLNEQDLVICLGVKDVQKTLTFIEGFGMFLKIKKKENYTLIRSGDYGDWYLVGKDKVLFLTTSPALKDAIVAGKGGLNNSSQALFNQKTAALEIDYKGYLADLKENPTPALTNILDKLQVAVSPLQNNAIEILSTLKLKDQNRNALPLILEALKNMPKRTL